MILHIEIHNKLWYNCPNKTWIEFEKKIVFSKNCWSKIYIHSHLLSLLFVCKVTFLVLL